VSDIRTIVNRYTFLMPFAVTRFRDADTAEGVAQAAATLDIPFLGVAIDATAPVPLVVRLEGVDAYEKNTAMGKEAIAFVNQWMDRIRVPDQTLYLATNGKRDNFGRLLGDLRLGEDHVTGLAWALLESGFAIPYSRHVAW
jgi:endonuclease YncB( thermonuclease family)